MTKKSDSPLAEIEKLHPHRASERATWLTRLEKADPDGFASLLIIIDDFNAGGITAQKMKTVKNLMAYLLGDDAERPIKKPLLPQGLTYNTFRELVNGRR